MSLKTGKKIAEHFPEAVPFLPKLERKMEIAPNFKELRARV